MRDWSSGQILRTAIADAYRSRMGGANPICIDLRRARRHAEFGGYHAGGSDRPRQNKL